METKNKTEINSTNQKELKEYANKLTMAYNGLLQDHNTLKEEHKQTLHRLNTMENNLTEALKSISLLTKRTIALETHLNEQNQYARNRQLELWKLDNDKIKNMNQDELKKEAADILSLVVEDDPTTKIEPSDIDVVHKLKRDGNIIIELKSRTLQSKVLRARKSLKGKKERLAARSCPRLSVVESMCQEYKRLDYICRRLVKDGDAVRTFFFNRKLFLIRLNDGNEQFIQVKHICDLENIYGEYKIKGYL